MAATPEESLAQVVEQVAILAAPGSEQERWAEDHGFLIDELMLQFFDMVPGWLRRLRLHEVIDENGELSLLRIEEAFEAMRALDNRTLWTEWEAVKASPEWQNIRQLAAQALVVLGVPDYDPG